MPTPEQSVVAKMFAAFAQKNVDEALTTVSSDSLWIYHGTQKRPSIRYVGQRGVRQFFETNFSTRQTEYFRVTSLLQDGNTVIALGEEKFTVTGQPEALAQKWVQVYTIEGGLITRMEEFATSAADADYGVVD